MFQSYQLFGHVLVLVSRDLEIPDDLRNRKITIRNAKEVRYLRGELRDVDLVIMQDDSLADVHQRNEALSLELRARARSIAGRVPYVVVSQASEIVQFLRDRTVCSDEMSKNEQGSGEDYQAFSDPFIPAGFKFNVDNVVKLILARAHQAGRKYARTSVRLYVSRVRSIRKTQHLKMNARRAGESPGAESLTSP